MEATAIRPPNGYILHTICIQSLGVGFSASRHLAIVHFSLSVELRAHFDFTMFLTVLFWRAVEKERWIDSLDIYVVLSSRLARSACVHCRGRTALAYTGKARTVMQQADTESWAQLACKSQIFCIYTAGIPNPACMCSERTS